MHMCCMHVHMWRAPNEVVIINRGNIEYCRRTLCSLHVHGRCTIWACAPESGSLGWVAPYSF